MKKAKRAVVGLFMAFVLCFGMFVGVAQAAPSSAYASVQDQDVVGVSVPDNEEYSEIMNYISQTNPDVEWRTSLYEEGALQDQVDGIYSLIDNGVDTVIIGGYHLPALLDVFQGVVGAGVGLIVLGDYVPGCPEGVLFLPIDAYYDLGKNHVDWVYRDALMTNDATVYIFYHKELNGLFYQKGILDGLEDHNFSGTIKMASIDTRQDLDAALDDWFIDGEDGASSMNEIVAHSSALAEAVLQRYYLEGYTDADFGTGIRVFSTPSGENRMRSAESSLEEALDEEYERYLNFIEEAANCIMEYLNGEGISGAQLINGCYVVVYEFGPGYAKYVSR